MPQGNYIAYQALKPVELKVGDYYAKFIDDYIKRGDAERATQAKLLAEQKKAIGERMDKLKLDPFATLSNFTDFANQSFKDTADYIGQQRLLAEQDIANSSIYIARAEKAANDYRTMATTFGDKNFIEKATVKQQSLANNDVFSETDNNQQLKMLGYQIPIYRRNGETGAMEFYLPENGDATDDQKLKKMSTGEITSLWTSPDEINMLRSNKSNGNNGLLDKRIPDVAKTMQDEWKKNTDGNRERGWEGFAQKRGAQWFDTTYGSYNANNIPTDIRQYAKVVLHKNIETEEDFNEVKNGIINNLASYVPAKETIDTKYTAAQLQKQQQDLVKGALDIIDKKLDIANGGSGRRNSGGGRGGGSSGGSGEVTNGSTAGMSYSAANQQVFVQTNTPKGKVVTQLPMRILTLPKLKGQPATDNVFGVTRYRNKQGKIVDAYYIGGYAEDGKITTTRVDGKELDSYFTKLGYNPITAKAYLYSQNPNQDNSEVPFIGSGQKPKYYNIPKYTKPVFFKTKESKTEQEQE